MIALPHAIGQFVIEWSHAERNLIRLMAKLSLDPPRGLTDPEYFEARDQWLDRNYDKWIENLNLLAARYSCSEAGQKIQEISMLFISAIEIRHDVMHGHFGGTTDSGFTVYKRKPRKKAHIEKLINFTDVWRWSKDVRKLISAIGALEIEINRGELS